VDSPFGLLAAVSRFLDGSLIRAWHPCAMASNNLSRGLRSLVSARSCFVVLMIGTLGLMVGGIQEIAIALNDSGQNVKNGLVTTMTQKGEPSC
jgi:hypothetical protein